MQIAVNVSKHPSGNHTLTVRKQGQGMPEDCQEPSLWCNSDAGSFYKAVAKKLAQLHSEGHEFTYQDMD